MSKGIENSKDEVQDKTYSVDVSTEVLSESGAAVSASKSDVSKWGIDYTSELAELEKLIPDALLFLVRGYMEYASDVVLARAIPAIDGFKKSQRRILYTMHKLLKNKGLDLTKCASVAGSTMALHPHGDEAIYAALVRLVESRESMCIPYIKGKGSFGKNYSMDPPASSRYTECMLSKISSEFFKEMSGVEHVTSFDDKLTEPLLLPVPFPVILCNPSQGIAVGLASNIPSFNFHEILKATIELIETGSIAKPLMPDYPSKGYYVEDKVELEKLMRTGRAKLRFRGKWHIDGKTINITEIPYYTTVQGIMKEIKEVKGISDVRDESDRFGLNLAIECVSKKVVSEVLTEVLKVSKLQLDIVTNIVTIYKDKPVKSGVIDVLKNWVEFRKGVLTTQLTRDLESVELNIRDYEILVDLVGNEERRKQFIDLLVDDDSKAYTFLKNCYPQKDNFDWIMNQKIRAFGNLDAKVKALNGYKMTKNALESDLEDISKVIVRQLKDLNVKYTYARKTEITDINYVFDNGDMSVKAAPTETIVFVDGKFIRKVQADSYARFVDGGISCMSDDVISFIDNNGRLLRLNLDLVDFCSVVDRGVYLPVALELPDDFEIVATTLVRDRVEAYMYSDGFASTVDYSEWYGAQRRTRLTQKGMPETSGLIMAEIDLNKSYIMLVTKDGRFGFASTGFKQKNRTGRTRIVNLKDGDYITGCYGVSTRDVLTLVGSMDKYMNRLSLLSSSDNFNIDFYNSIVGATV